MMLAKRNLGRGKVRVTFTMPPLEGVTQLNLVGDFNNWSITATPMQPGPDGSWSAALTLEGGREYQFRYLANGSHWHNDWAADRYAPNLYGSDNSVVNLKVDGQPASSRKRPSRKKAGRA